MNNNTKQSFVNCTLSSDNFIYDPDKAKAGVEALKTIMKNIREDYSQLLNSKLDAFYEIDAMKGTDKYKEDNLFYDISVEAMCEESGHGENYDDVIKQYPGFIADYIQRLIDKINDHIDAYEYYSGRKDFSKTVKEMMSKLKGNSDLELSLDDLTVLSREKILEKYGLKEEDLERDPNTIEFASEEEKNNYFEALQYMNNDFYNLQRLYSIGNAEDYADKLVSVESRVNHLDDKTSETNTESASEVPLESTMDNKDVKVNEDSEKENTIDDNISTQNTNNESSTNSSSGVSSSTSSSSGGGSSSSSGSSSNGSSSGGSSRRASTYVPETSNVETVSMEEHQNEMKAATEASKNTTAFDERDAYEERVANEQKAQADADNAKQAPAATDNVTKIEETTKDSVSTQTETTSTETKTNSSTTDASTSSTTSNETQTTTQQSTTTEATPVEVTTTPVVETTPVQTVENVAPVNVQPATQTVQPTTEVPAVTTTVPEIKDMISEGKTTQAVTTPKADSSKMVSSVTSNSTPLKPIKIEDTTTTKEPTSNTAKFIPPIAGVSTAAVAGLGAKLYIDKKDEEKDKKDKKKENKFFDESIQEDNDSKLNFSSKEDIIRLLDR